MSSARVRTALGVAAVLLVVIALVAGCTKPADSEQGGAAAPPVAKRGGSTAPPPAAQPGGKVAPEFELDSLEGGQVKLSDHKDKDVVVLDFWATWCHFCIESMPTVLKVEEQYKGKAVAFYAVDEKEDAGKVQAFLNQKGLKPNVLLDPTGSVGRDYGADKGIPHMVIIGKDGMIAYVQEGADPKLETILKTALDKALQ